MFRDILNPVSWFRRRSSGGQDKEAGGEDIRQSESANQAVPGPADKTDTAVRTYSRRMLPPFSGLLQVAESGDARAFSIDGKNWEIQYRYTANATDARPHPANPDKRQDKYTPVASITPAGLERQSLHAFLDTDSVSLAIERLYDSISQSDLPYPAIDRFEYWLLDQAEQQPLALLNSCISAEEMGAPAVRPTWRAMPAAQLCIDETAEQSDGYVAPVNARLESMIAERAGPSPRAAWFDRAETTDIEFPTCLISENWDQEEENRLCRLYIRRLAPRLLMLQGLDHADRQRLEQAACENALDVERFYPLYPEVIDRKRLKALRVEARLRHSV